MTKSKPERYVVLHNHKSYQNTQSEPAWATYNTKLDNQSKTSAYNMAVHTASRYNGEIFEDYGDGVLNTVKSYRKDGQNNTQN